jgi:aldehyde:ferredoxin oxidoreductase
MYGWAGKILRVDLTSGKIEKQPLSEELRRDYIGGRGTNVKMLYDEVRPGTDGLAPENRLIFGTGPFTGTMLASGRLNITAMSPLTRILGDANGGSHFSPELKYAGYDHVVITGKADKPVYLWIDDDAVELRDAQHLWGKMTNITQTMIQEELGDLRISVACIGPAGENLVRFASILVGTDGWCAKTGLGAVMGAKNLKAVAVRGTKGVKVAWPNEFRAYVRDLIQRVKKNPIYPVFSTHGTNLFTIGKGIAGTFAVRNAQETGQWDHGWKELNPERQRERYYIKNKACFGCINHCRRWFSIKDGPYAGEKGEVLEYGPMMGWGPLCDIYYVPAIYKANELCNQYGLESSECAQLIASLMEWYEKGLISKENLEGIELKWGNYEAAIEMVHKIANRSGIGDMLAEGCVQAAKKIGKEAERCITHCKGAIRTSGDIRGMIGYLLGEATSTRGADHLRGSVVAGVKLGNYNVAKLVYDNQNVCTIADALEICKFSTTYIGLEISLKEMAELFPLVTGVEINEEGLIEIADRIWNLERAFIVREGISRKDDIMVGRYTDEPVHGGPLNGFKHDQKKWDKLLDEYYDLVGWNKNTGVPTQAKLESLGLGYIASELKGMGKLEGG